MYSPREEWDDSLPDTRIFDGLPSGEDAHGWDYVSPHTQQVFTRVNPRWGRLSHFQAYRTPTHLPWAAQYTRYLLRPRAWFSRLLQWVGRHSLMVHQCSTEDLGEAGEGGRSCGSTAVGSIPRPFLSLHVRYSPDKQREVGLMGGSTPALSRYMGYLQMRHPGIRRLFLSTETPAVLEQLAAQYPQYSYYYLNYTRLPDLRVWELSNLTDYEYEFVLSMTGLGIAAEADGFIGTLSSNWGRVLQGLQLTRGDGGVNYASVDGFASSHTECV